MKEELKTGEMMEAAREARRRLEHEQEELTQRAEQLKGFMTALETTEDVLQENERLEEEMEQLRSQHQEEIEQLRSQHQEEIEQLRQQYQEEKDLLRQQLQDEKDKNTKLEMQLNEMSKMTASVAGKASQEEVQKALRVFVNKSKRKKMDKRIAVKEMVLELANANGLVLPPDLAATIDSLDDEQPPEPQPSEVPEMIAKSKYWQKLKAAGLIDDNNQPTVSRPEAALMAEALAKRIGIENKWKVFEQLWKRNNMRNDFNTALEQKKSLEFQERLKIILD
jgi:hypothetical protein